MRFTVAARTRFVALGLGFGAASLGLAGCGTIDDSLFGSGSTPPAAATPATATPATADAGTPPPDAGSTGDVAAAAPAAVPVPADLGITLAVIEPGADTGTPVGQTVARLRGELSTVHDKVAADLQQYATLKNAGAQDVTTYFEAKSHITIRLQVGTTKGNPDLVNEWNTGQTALDTLTGTINSLATLGTDLSADAGRAHTERDTVADAFNMAGGNDEDHRQLTVLQQEADQLVGALDNLQSHVSHDVQRQTAFVAHERTNLAALQSDIKNGELYEVSDMAPTASASSAGATVSSGSADSVIAIKLDRAKVDYEQDLYKALNQALQAKPGASFRVVAISPTGGSAAAMQKAQRTAQHNAQSVLKSMTDMGVPAARVAISSSTDPAATSTEVRVYEK